MGIFDTDLLGVEEDMDTQQKIVESMIVMDLQKLPSDVLREFCNSSEAESLVEARVLSKPTLVRLSKKDDETRRVKLCAFEICKKENKALWQKLVQNRVKEKQLINQIMAKYGTRAKQEAKLSQKAYIKAARGIKLPKNFGGAER